MNKRRRYAAKRRRLRALHRSRVRYFTIDWSKTMDLAFSNLPFVYPPDDPRLSDAGRAEWRAAIKDAAQIFADRIDARIGAEVYQTIYGVGYVREPSAAEGELRFRRDAFDIATKDLK